MESKPRGYELQKRKMPVLIKLSRGNKDLFYERKWLRRNRREEIVRGGEIRTEEIHNK